jgi:metallo-beta-lactamase class B
MLRVVRSSLLLCFLSVALFAQRDARERAAWNQPVEPFRIIGNVYYVGVSGVTAYLITTPKGGILLDGGLAETAPLIEKNVAALGFRMEDVKYLLNSHAHYDHAGGLSELKRVSGAQMVASRGDAGVLEAGRQIGFDRGKDSLFPAVKVDRIVNDGETVQLANVTLTANLTPGHTKGCTTWTMPVNDGAKTYNVVFYCSTTVPGYQLINNRKYPGIVSDYKHSFARLRQLPCDIFLAPHGSFFHLEEKRVRMRKGGANPFIDSTEFRAFIDRSEQDFDRELEEQQAAAVRK